MNTAQRIRQEQACHIRFKQLQREGVLASDLSMYAYAHQIVGVQVESLKDLKDFELNALRDALEGKPVKVFDKLKAVADASGIRDLASWMRAVARRDSMAWLRGFTPETLPISKQWRLVKLLERRRA